jgi:predicted  nucleic acid-binding Zn-ribbon protein
MQELDGNNSVLTLEIHNLKTELLSSQDTIKQKENEMDRLREEIVLCQQNFKSAEEQIKNA